MNSVEDATVSNLSGMMENAVASLRMGIEDYAALSPERALSAVRNFYAGVLLLGKEVLVRAAPLADPDEVIGARYEPVRDGQGGVEHVMQGQQTIDFQTLGRRFKTFGIAIDTKLLEELNGLRNAIEHRYTNQTTDAVREAIARAFPIVAAMFRQAGERPEDLLGDAWPTMLEVRALYEAERESCRQTLARIEWVSSTVAHKHLACVECGSDLIEQTDPHNKSQSSMELRCRSCGEEPNWSDSIVDAVDRALSGEGYMRFKDSGEMGQALGCHRDKDHALFARCRGASGEQACKAQHRRERGKAVALAQVPLRFLVGEFVFHGCPPSACKQAAMGGRRGFQSEETPRQIPVGSMDQFRPCT